MWRVLAVTLGTAWLAAASTEASVFKAAECATDQALSKEEQALLLMQHVPSGLPSNSGLAVRRAYVTAYDSARRIPRWAAWLARPDFRDTPERKGRWKRFHPDPAVDNPVRYEDYTGLYDRGRGFARGHIVPYFISGGDRDADGMDAEVEDAKGWPVEDADDACTVFEVNYMSNVAPQYHNRFNGAGGLWWELEAAVRDFVDSGRALHLIAGPVFEAGLPVVSVGPEKDIQVPHGFFKIVITEGGVVAFLFGHHPAGQAQGCALDAELTDCVTSVDKIEAVSGLDFFSVLPEGHQSALETVPNDALWRELGTLGE